MVCTEMTLYLGLDWTGKNEGDFFRSFKSLSLAIAAVADGGVIKIIRGTGKEKLFLPKNKRMTLVAEMGDVGSM